MMFYDELRRIMAVYDLSWAVVAGEKGHVGRGA